MNALITGGAGFVGVNLARRLLALGHRVTVLDNVSRPGSKQNLQWLAEGAPAADLRVVEGDVRDRQLMQEAMAGKTVVFHLASQVAVTASVREPREDLEINLLGTFGVLEAIRQMPPDRRPCLIFTSTNKVYGRMDDVPVVEARGRYDYATLTGGVSEARPLDFHSPYGCSKGAADQYVRDYARIYGLRTVVFRMSCIYGTRQCGTEDQGWVAHFLISALLGRPLSIYGDGKQVRDILFVDDLVAAFLAAVERIEHVTGDVFNIGGGPGNTVSLLELLDWLDQRADRPVARTFREWRPGDQRIYVSDVGKARERLGWVPSVTVPEGLDRLWRWVRANRALF